MHLLRRHFVALSLRSAIGMSALMALSASAQTPTAPRKSGPGEIVKPLEESGFKPIFDGKSLSGWDGDTTFWRVENGAIIGQTETDKQPKQNTFLIWRGGSPANFEIKLEYKLTGYNSGLQVRSVELPDIKYAMKGYQADIDGKQQYTGQFYEERGRGFLALRGQASYIATGEKPAYFGTLGVDEELKGLIKSDDWNTLHIIARGNTLVQILNGRVMSMVIDDDTQNRKMEGLIGLQVHKGPAMKIEFRNIRLKSLP